MPQISLSAPKRKFGLHKKSWAPSFLDGAHDFIFFNYPKMNERYVQSFTFAKKMKPHISAHSDGTFGTIYRVRWWGRQNSNL